MKVFLFLLPVFLLTGCYFTNTNVLNFPVELNKLKNSKKDNPEVELSIKTLYKLNNGMLIDKLNENYGYWYCVNRGDTLNGISRRCGLSIRELAKINNLRINTLLTYKSFLFIPISDEYLKNNTESISIKLKKGDFIWPLFGRITSNYGIRKWGWRNQFHKGLDIGGSPGMKIISARDGEVFYAGYQAFYGKVVIIKHNDNFETIYAHMSKILVQTGETVGQGQIIGLVGMTGHATGYHLHFEIRIDKLPVNPNDYLLENANELAKLYSSEIKPAITR